MAFTHFELRLPALALEAGCSIAQHVVRGVCASLEPRDAASLRASGIALPDASLLGDPRPVRRRHAELQSIAAPAWPPLAPNKAAPRKTILIVHALTGDARATGPNGYWAQLGKPSALLDLEQYRVLSFNLLGSCYGTSGPCDAGFPQRADQLQEADACEATARNQAVLGKGAFHVPGSHPATVTTMDQARSILMTLDALGIDGVELAVGGSLGGMVVLALGTLAPQRFRALLPIAATASASPWLCAWNHLARGAIVHDRERGFELARQIGMLSYRAEPGLVAAQTTSNSSLLGPKRVQTWLEHHGEKLRARFDVDAYLCLLGAMDSHDLQRVESWATELARTRILGVSIDTDQLFTPSQTQAYLASLQRLGAKAEAAEITSLHGHDAFLIELDQVASLIQRALCMQ
jgi:homoserine O-acetyltransferase/O-succinyltransferase